MRNIIIVLSVIIFTLSGIITFKAVSIPARNIRYQNTPVVTESKELSPDSQDILGKLAKEQAADRDLVEKLQATIVKLEDELLSNNEEARVNVEPEVSKEKPRVIAVLGAGALRSGQVVINEDMMNVVKELIPDILASPDHRVIIEGHTDNIPVSSSGGKQYIDNMDLSFLRAKAVTRILVENGISPGRISIIGYGDTRPIASNETKEGRVKNRRVEVKLEPGDKEF